MNHTQEKWEERYKAPRDIAYFAALEEVLDEYFPKIEEEGEEKRANRRGAALMLFNEACALHNHRISSVRESTLEEAIAAVPICMLREASFEEMRVWNDCRSRTLTALTALKNKV